MAVSTALISLILIHVSQLMPQSPDEWLSEMGCGPVALCMGAELLNRTVSRDFVIQEFGPPPHAECSLEEIHIAATKLGLFSQPVAMNPDAPQLASHPMIVALRKTSPTGKQHNHFVVLYGMKEGNVQVIDYPRRTRFVPIADLSVEWDGRGLYLASNSDDLVNASGVPSRDYQRLRTISLCLLTVCLASLVFFHVRQRKSLS